MSSEPDAIRVVVIDDHQVMVESLEVVLTRQPDVAIVGSALSIEAGVAVVAEHQPDVVLLDFHLGDGNALEAIPRLLHTAPATHVIVLTALAPEDVLMECLRVGATGFVTKQQSITEVVAAIRSAAAGQIAVGRDALAAARSALAAPPKPPVAELTAREREVLTLLADGLPNKEISERLYLSVNTVRNHVAAILDKLGARTRAEATAIAHRDGWLTGR